MVTIIRHKVLKTGFMIVVTDFEMGYSARFQRYSIGPDGRTVLEDESIWSNEKAAIDMFDYISS